MRCTAFVWPLCFVLSWQLASCAEEESNSITKETLEQGLHELQRDIDKLSSQSASKNYALADLLVFAKAAEWILRHDEFYKPDYLQQTENVLKIGAQRADAWAKKQPDWLNGSGKAVVGYVSRVDNSVQPYVISLPQDFSNEAKKARPLHVVLHGRAGTMNEVNFIHRHEGKAADEVEDWIQIDVFGRTNNAYRWAGETDVFEAIDDVCKRFSIDLDRIVLRGFSMGGAGAWHLGMHYPDRWCSVGPGAGFVDFYKYQNRKERLPIHQHLTLGIYDSIDYALNAFNVPVCTYGGELDKQLVAGASMTEAAKKLGVDIKLIVGPGMGHKFDPKSRREFLEFHQRMSEVGRKKSPRDSIRFTTRTLKYNKCDWLTILGLEKNYHDAIVNGERTATEVTVTTENVEMLQISRAAGKSVRIDGQTIENSDDTLQLKKTDDRWLRFNQSSGSRLIKKKDLQGPIDDAFMQPFVCVRGTGTPWNKSHQAWADWTLGRFKREFDKWLRGSVVVVDDTEVSQQHIQSANLILFGDPGSNALINQVLARLPVQWKKDQISVNGKDFTFDEHGLSMIYPNPLNADRYVVINSGHTFHEQDFKASNAWLFPRLGDIAVQRFSQGENGEYKEETVWADIFNTRWQLTR